MFEKTFKQLKISFALSIIISISFFIWDVLYTSKYVEPVESIALERWVIIITLFGIFSALKLLHPKLKDSDKENPVRALKKYASKYYIRLVVLFSVYMFNASLLYFTGIKNFLFLAFITIFAQFLCIPNKQYIKNETGIENN